jgi:hypothetical protein
MAYRYDQLNRLRQARGITGIGAANSWHGVNAPLADRYRSAYTYDANGNIRTALRHDDGGSLHDQLRYFYQHQPNAPGKLLRNRLLQLTDEADQPNALVNEPGGAQDIARLVTLPICSPPEVRAIRCSERGESCPDSTMLQRKPSGWGGPMIQPMRNHSNGH